MTPITFAHRGGRAHARENSLAAFRNALDLGARGVESDVRLSRDGIPVLAHDRGVRRGLRRHKVADTDAADLAALDVPSLTDLYDVVGDAVHVSLDLKDVEAAEPVIETARRVGPEALRRLWLCSPDLGVVRRLRHADADVRLVHSTTRTAIKENLERHASGLAEAGIDAFNLHRTEWSAGLVVLYQRFGLRAFAWDVQEVRHVRDVLAFGVDAIYSDHVDRMVGVVAEWTEAHG